MTKTNDPQLPEVTDLYGSFQQRQEILLAELGVSRETLLEQPGGTFRLREQNLLKDLERKGKLTDYAKRLSASLPATTAWVEETLHGKTANPTPPAPKQIPKKKDRKSKAGNSISPKTVPDTELQAIITGHKVLVRSKLNWKG